MRAVDTNVLVRLVTRDDARQVAAAERFIAPGAWVSHVALVEMAWVLDAVYGLGRTRIATAVAMLLEHQHLSVQDADVVLGALAQYRAVPGIEFSDCLLLAGVRKAGHGPLGTFDRSLGKLDGTLRL